MGLTRRRSNEEGGRGAIKDEADKGALACHTGPPCPSEENGLHPQAPEVVGLLR